MKGALCLLRSKHQARMYRTSFPWWATLARGKPKKNDWYCISLRSKTILQKKEHIMRSCVRKQQPKVRIFYGWYSGIRSATRLNWPNVAMNLLFAVGCLVATPKRGSKLTMRRLRWLDGCSSLPNGAPSSFYSNSTTVGTRHKKMTLVSDDLVVGVDDNSSQSLSRILL